MEINENGGNDCLSLPSESNFENKEKGRWSKNEHLNFLAALKMFGTNWDQV